jgi:outer membrane protein assembly factor BamA
MTNAADFPNTRPGRGGLLAAILCGLWAGTALAAAAKSVVGRVEVRGTEPTAAGDVRRAAGLKKGDPATPESLSAARERALLFLRSAGRLEARVTVASRAEPEGAAVLITVEEGPLTRFGDTRVEGLDKLPRGVVERELSYRPGDAYDRRRLFDTRRRLYLTGLFQEIRIDASTNPARAADVTVRVKERPLKWIKGGVGWGSEESQRVTLQLIDENLFHQAYKGQLTTQWSRIWFETRADLITRYFLGTRTQLRTTGGWRREDREGYRLERLTAEAFFSRALSGQLTAGAGYQFERTVTFEVNPQIAAVTPDLSDSRSLIGTLEWNGANDYFFPTRGARSKLRLQRAGGALGGTIHFNKALIDGRTYVPLGAGWVAAAAARGGVVVPFGPSADVPIFDRIFTGGANTVRGYRERGVGPKDALGSPLGGTWSTGGNLEVRFPLVKQLFGAAFIDGGMTALSRREALPSEWRYGAGGGLRFRTPVGPVRIDYGYKLNRDPRDPDLWRIHLSLGEAF